MDNDNLAQKRKMREAKLREIEPMITKYVDEKWNNFININSKNRFIISVIEINYNTAKNYNVDGNDIVEILQNYYGQHCIVKITKDKDDCNCERLCCLGHISLSISAIIEKDESINPEPIKSKCCIIS